MASRTVACMGDGSLDLGLTLAGMWLSCGRINPSPRRLFIATAQEASSRPFSVPSSQSLCSLLNNEWTLLCATAAVPIQLRQRGISFRGGLQSDHLEASPKHGRGS